MLTNYMKEVTEDLEIIQEGFLKERFKKMKIKLLSEKDSIEAKSKCRKAMKIYEENHPDLTIKYGDLEKKTISIKNLRNCKELENYLYDDEGSVYDDAATHMDTITYYKYKGDVALVADYSKSNDDIDWFEWCIFGSAKCYSQINKHQKYFITCVGILGLDAKHMGILQNDLMKEYTDMK